MPDTPSFALLSHSLRASLPEGCILLAFLVLAALEFLPRPLLPQFSSALSLFLALSALFTLCLPHAEEKSILFFGHFETSTALRYVKGLILSCYMFSLVLVEKKAPPTRLAQATPSLFAALVLAAMLSCAAHSFLALFLSLSLGAISTYLLCAAGPNKQAASTALKYLLYGMLGMGSLAYGFSWLYAYLQPAPLLFSNFSALFSLAPAALLPILGLILIGFAFKLGTFPLPVWVPSVFRDMPLAGIAFLSTGMKLAILTLLYRFSSAWADYPAYGLMLALMGLGGALWGNTAGLVQRTPRAWLAYSSIAYAGLITLVIASQPPALPFLFACTFYALSQYSCFASLSQLPHQGQSPLNPKHNPTPPTSHTSFPHFFGC